MRLPEATLGPVRRLRVMAAGIPGAVLIERVFDATFDEVWALAGDLEHGVPRWEPMVSSVRVLERQGERMRVLTRTPFRTSFSIDAIVRRGWCWMQTVPRFYVIGMAAEPEGSGTRFAQLEGSPLPGGRLLQPLVHLDVAYDLHSLGRLLPGS
jgi:hypothetical protein